MEGDWIMVSMAGLLVGFEARGHTLLGTLWSLFGRPYGTLALRMYILLARRARRLAVLNQRFEPLLLACALVTLGVACRLRRGPLGDRTR
jgi:hypothetical protein